MQIRKWLAITTLSFGASALPLAVLAQASLSELVRAGDTDDVRAALQAPGVEIDAREADGSTALLWATYQSNHELVRALLNAGADPSATNSFGSSPLAEATKLADVELVRMLLDAGAKPDAPNLDNQTPLMIASNLGKLDIARLLIEHGADVNAVESFRGQNALMWAAAENHPDIVELLIENGADVHPRAFHDDWPRQMTSEPRAQFRPTGGLTALLYATRSGCYRCAVAIVEAGADVNRPNPDGITPLLNAIDSKNFDIAMYLIDEGANVHVWDMHGRTPFYMAIDMNSFRGGGFGGFGGGLAPAPNQEYTAMDVARRLVDMGVDVNHQLTRMRPNGPGRGRFADYMMRGGTGPLMVATLSNDHEAIEFLLQNGAEVDLYNVFKTTPLMVAANMSGTGRGNNAGGSGRGDDPQATAIKTIDLLLGAGAEINKQVTDSRTFTAKLDTYVAGKDNEGRTALHAAAESGWDRVVAHLLAKGADPTLVDAQGETALDVALAAAANAASQPNYGGQAKASRDATIAALATALGVDPAAAAAAAATEATAAE